MGGSSQINYMLHFGGVRKDFDELESYGGKEWGYDSLKQFLSVPLDFEDSEEFCEKINEEVVCSKKTDHVNQYLKVRTIQCVSLFLNFLLLPLEPPFRTNFHHSNRSEKVSTYHSLSRRCS